MRLLFFLLIRRLGSTSSTAVTAIAEAEMRVLNVAEKNAAASSIANILGNGQYDVFGQQCQMVMTSVSGHLMESEFPPAYKKWTAVSPLVLFDAPVQKSVSQNNLPIKRTLEEEARRAQKLVIWTDCDREGENIGYEVIDVCKNVNRNLDVYRAKFSEMTRPAIHRAINNLGRPDIRMSQAVDVRSELDLRTGAAFTRFQTLRLTKLYRQVLEQMVISYGSCQFPTLGFVVDRYKQIKDFVIEDFWKIKLTHSVQDQVADFNWARVRLFDEQACRAILQLLKEKPIATVTSVSSKPKSKWRPQAMDTVEMEKLAVRKLKMTAKKAMGLAESLYQRGIISYPRTETNIFPRELNLNSLIEQHVNHQNWGQFASKILNEGGARARNGSKTDNAHPPIHPTRCVAPNEFQNQEEVRLYELITRHFLACCSADAEGKEYIVEIDVNGESFSAAGLTILALNYLEVYPYDKWSEKTIPEYQQGQQFEPTVLDIVSGQTAPPPLLSEADLISLMEKHGIGTDATHAEHIDKIQQRLYVGVTAERRFTPGELGMGLVEGYDSMGFSMSKPNLRAEFEADLCKICDGSADPKQVLATYIAKYRETFQQTIENARKLDDALAQYLGAPQPGNENNNENLDDFPGGPGPGHGPGGGGDGGGGGGDGGGGGAMTQQKMADCPSCGSEIRLKTRKTGGFFFGCSGFPNCKVSVFLPDSVQRVAVSDEVCQRCNFHPHLVEMTFKSGQTPPGLDSPFRGCVGGCDSSLLDLLGTRPLVFQSRSSNSFGSSSNSNAPQNTAVAVRGQNAVVSTGSSKPFGNFGNRGGDDPMADNILCVCNKPAAKLTVRKEGPNQGRQFFKCADSACTFFLWDDDFDTSGGGGGGNQSRKPSASQGGGNNKTCKCGQPAVRLISKSEKNTGRAYWACRPAGTGGCGQWLEWADEPGSSSSYAGNSSDFGNDNNRGGGGNQGRARGWGGNQVPQVPVNRPGFLGGGHMVGRGGGGGGKAGRGGGGRGAAAKRSYGGGDDPDTPSAPKQRKCGNCGQPGHNRKNCPN